MEKIINVLENQIQSNVMKASSITQFYIENILHLNEELDGTYRRQANGFLKNDEKYPKSYTAIIAQAILSSKEKKLPLGCIYEYIIENFPQFLSKGKGWKNCVRHNLSLSECFIKVGRARNVRGNYWGIHPKYLKNFSKGDYRKKRFNHSSKNHIFTINGSCAHFQKRNSIPYLPEKIQFKDKFHKTIY
ncbi:forkhead box protein I3 [Hydra vulgaris]|uniref:forkhead box protein I3 n=1 Tax=Hydra vulgaris TaxID=6087 RepID=UPI0002B40E59|nr:forkhead box protein I1c [Hydra vulgaris]